MDQMILFPVSLPELMDRIRDIVKEELHNKQEKEIQATFLSPEEVCKLFSPAITKPTLESYFKKKLINKYRISGRTWYKYSEVIDATKVIKRFSHNNDLLAI